MTDAASQAVQQTGGWKTARFVLEAKTWPRSNRRRPWLMGVLNVTPDSFSDGGQFNTVDAALKQARALLDEGADLLDIGAESTRPGAQAVDAKAEWQRLAPLLRELVTWKVPLSLDSMKPDIMRRGLELGVDVLNDVGGFTDPDARTALLQSSAGAVIMHMQGQPRSMQHAPTYNDCVAEVSDFLQARLCALTDLGIEASRLMVDPGFGFGKTLDHNIALFKAIAQFSRMGAGVLVGVSRKFMIGQLLNQPDPLRRVHGSIAAAVHAARSGAQVLRVHDVGATRDALWVDACLSE